MADQIRIIDPLCLDCDRRAIGLVRWPGRTGAQGHYWPKCEQDVPWHDPEAVVVGILRVNVDLNDPAVPDRPGADPAVDTDHGGRGDPAYPAVPP